MYVQEWLRTNVILFLIIGEGGRMPPFPFGVMVDKGQPEQVDRRDLYGILKVYFFVGYYSAFSMSYIFWG